MERTEGKTAEMIWIWGKQGKKYKLRQPSQTLEDSQGDLGGLARPDDRYWKILNETTKVQKKCTNSKCTHNNSPTQFLLYRQAQDVPILQLLDFQLEAWK